MGAKADRDFWGQALIYECQYGDRAAKVVATKVKHLEYDGDLAEAAFWSQVADCLNELHAIRYPGSGSKKLAAHFAAQRDPLTPSPTPS